METKSKNAIIFDHDSFRYQQFISDLNGVDIKAHGNDPNVVIRKIRDWLSVSSHKPTIPGHVVVQNDYRSLVSRLPEIAANLGLTTEDMSFDDFCLIVEETVSGVL